MMRVLLCLLFLTALPAVAQTPVSGQTEAAETSTQWLESAADYASRGQALPASLAYFQAKDWGRAQIWTLRALQSDPFHPEALANLAYIREKTGSLSGSPLLWLESQPVRWLWLASVLLLFNGGLIWAGWRFWNRNRAFSRGPVVLLGLCGLLVATGALSGLVLPPRAVVVQETPAWKGDSQAFAPIRAEVFLPGTEVLLLGQRQGWQFGETLTGLRGWWPAQTLERVVP